MPKDPRIQAAIAFWGPRFTVAGVSYADFQEITAKLDSWDDWCRAWSNRAAIDEQLGREAVDDKRFITAGEHLQRAGVYYHFASFLFVHDQAQMKDAHLKSVACRNAALPYLRPPGERVEIPYENTKIVGILRKPPGVERPPVAAMSLGLDSHKEESDVHETPFLARGIATLVFEGPGQGELQYDTAIRGDYEVAYSAVMDFIETRKDLDAGRIGLWGVSLGGYYAPRGAAFDKRAKCCVALGGPFALINAWEMMPPLTLETLRVRGQCADMEGTRRLAASMTLEDCAQNITCPTYIMNGRHDTILPCADAELLARKVSGPVTLNILEDGNHVGSNRAHLWRAQSCDWMLEKLRAV